MENRTYDEAVPKRYDVGSAAQPRSIRIDETLAEPVRSGGMRSKFERLRSVGLERLHEVQRSVTERGGRGVERLGSMKTTLSDRTMAIKSSVTERVGDLRPAIRESAARLGTDMRTNTPKWAGIAAGAGLALGIGGRMLRHRLHHRQEHFEGFVIIEAC